MKTLDPVLRELAPDERIPVAKTLLYVDPRSGRLLDGKPGTLKSLFGGRPRRFLVHTEATGAVAVRRDMAVTVHSPAGSLEVRLNYRLHCPEGAERAAVEALIDGPSPQARLEELLADWLRAYLLDHEEEMFTAPLALVSDAEDHLAERLTAASGLVLRPHVHFTQPPWLQPRRLGPIHLSIEVSEADEPVDLRLEALLVVDPAARRRAFDAYDRHDELLRRAPEILTAYARSHFGLHQLSFELAETVAPAFRRILDRHFAPVGRKAETVAVTGGESEARRHDVAASTRIVPGGTEHEIGVEARAELELTDLGIYSRVGRPDLHAWFQERLDEETRHLSFGLRLSQLHEDPDRLRAPLAAALLEAAGALGFRARVLVDLHNLDLAIPARVTCHHSAAVTPRLETVELQVHARGVAEADEAGCYVDAGRPDLQALFEKHLEEAVRPLYNRTRPELLLGKDRLVAQIAGELVAGFERIGYRLETYVELAGASEDLAFRSLRHQIELQVPEAPAPVTLQGRFLFELADAEGFTASGVTDLAAWARRELGGAAKRVLFGRNYRELSVLDRDLRPKMADFLVAAAGRIGYELSVSLAVDGIDTTLRDPCYCSFEFPCQASGYAEPVLLQVVMMLLVEDPDLFLAAGAPDLTAWAKQEVERIAKDHLFAVRFTDLCIDLDAHKLKIERLIREAAARMGVAVKQLTTFTDLVLEGLRRGERLVVDGDFPTSLSGVEVAIELHAEVRTVQPEALREVLDKHPALIHHFESTVRRRLEQELRRIDPAVFYTEFQEPVARSRKPVARRIEDAARKVLEGEFRLEVLDILCRQKRSEIADLCQALLAENHALEVGTEPLGGQLPLRFGAELRVEGIDGQSGWRSFYQKAPKSETLVASARSHLLGFLADQEPAELRTAPQEVIRRRAEASLRNHLAADLGLIVSLPVWRRRATKIESFLADVTEEDVRRDIQHFQTIRREARERRRNVLKDFGRGLLTAEAAEEELERLQDTEAQAAASLTAVGVSPLRFQARAEPHQLEKGAGRALPEPGTPEEPAAS